MLSAFKIGNDLYRICNAGCDVYLFDDPITPVMIDCGCSKDNIKEYAEKLIGKTIENVLITHAHIDHCGHAGLFRNVFMTKETFLTARNPMDENLSQLHLEYEPIFIEDKQILKFGSLSFEVILCDTHCNGNVLYLEKSHGILFTGDEIDCDQVLLLPSFAYEKGKYHSKNAASVKQYRDMLMRIWKRNDEYEMLCTGHNGSPLLKKVILDMIELCECILNGDRGKIDCSSPSYCSQDMHFPNNGANYLRFERNHLALVYCADDLYKTENNSRISPATRLHTLCEQNLK